MGIKIITDAGSNLYASILKKKNLDIKVIPMTLDVDGKLYFLYDEEVNIEEFSKDIYDKMENGANVKTSLASPDAWEKAMREEVEKGNKVLVFTLASGISGNYNASRLAAEAINEEYNDNLVQTIDTKTAALGEGAQAIRAYELAQGGMEFEELVTNCKEFVERQRSEFSVMDIKYLAKSGRVSKLVAKIASILNIKVILKGGEDSTIQLYKKTYGRTKCLKELADICLSHIVNKDQIVYITQCDALDAALTVKKLLNEGGVKNVEIEWFDIVTGSHVGRGTLAVFYEGENRK